MVSFPGTALHIPSGRKEDYFRAMRSSRRYNLRRKLRRSAESLDAVVEAVQHPDAALLDDIYDLFDRTRSKSDLSLERLDLRFFERISKEPTAHFILLRERQSGDLVAFKLCFEAGRNITFKYIGIDYDRPKDWFLFFRVFDAALDWALARGATFFQSGQTGYAGKLEQGFRLMPLTVYGKHRNGLMHWVCHLVAKRIRWATLDDELAEYVRAHPDTQ
jgi:predicted N-acyltransferase